MSKEKILIVNAIPLNNGDAALVFSLYNKLKEKGHEVKIATYYYDEVRKHYPNYPFVKELAQHKIFVKLPFLKALLLPLLFYFSKTHREATLLIGAPGGYINSNYNIKSSLQVFQIAKKKGKKTAVYAQSVGPLNTKDTVYLTHLLQNTIDYILLRDQYSYDMVAHLDVPRSKYAQTKDAAFLLQPDSKDVVSSKKVAISVREWGYDNRNRKQYLNLISTLTKSVIDQGYKVVFLSTCQGIKTYKNDALLAEEIVQTMEDDYKKHISIDTSYHTFDSFYGQLKGFDFVIGTRLHMCILAMTNRVPAFNISYEIKGKETYSYLGLAPYSIDYNANKEESILALASFIANLQQTKKHLQSKIATVQTQVEADFEVFHQKMIG